MFDLNGKIAIVTGASRGIGRGVAELLASRGAHVIAFDMDEQSAGIDMVPFHDLDHAQAVEARLDLLAGVKLGRHRA